ncbi:hypothetical protein [Paraburkholderia azotifigens]|uniref:hypothetical protein n=1 Tax=Paraburkholderia azotifigens TaxID=2057004 RepID=UPI001F02A0E7|nr:hypothetical protein [Paraburkholderia azotifigens]
MATITERGPCQWRAQVRRCGHPAQSKTFETKAEAEAWARMIESEMAWGGWVSRGKAKAATLHEALQRYEAEISQGKEGSIQEASGRVFPLQVTQYSYCRPCSAPYQRGTFCVTRNDKSMILARHYTRFLIRVYTYPVSSMSPPDMD